MNASVVIWEAAGTKISKARWNDRARAAENAANVAKMIDEGSNLKYVVFDKGTVWPEGVTGRHGAHADLESRYSIKGVRDWLFDRKKQCVRIGRRMGLGCETT